MGDLLYVTDVKLLSSAGNELDVSRNTLNRHIVSLQYGYYVVKISVYTIPVEIPDIILFSYV